MLKPTRAQLLNYSVAVLCVGVALGLTFLLRAFTNTPIVALFFGAVAVSAWYGGARAGLLSTFLSTLCIGYFFTPLVEPNGEVSLVNLVRVAVFVLVTLVISSLNSELRSARRRSDKALQERQQLMQELEAKQQLLETVLQQMPAAVVAAAPTGQLILMNQQVRQILRNPDLAVDRVEDYSKHPAYYADGSAYAPRDLPLARSLHSGETVFNEEMGVQCGDGTRRSVLASSSPIHDAEGQIVAAVLTFQDITERKQAAQALRESESRFKRLVTSNVVGCLFWHVDGTVLDANDAFLEMVGYTQADLQAGLNWRSLTPPEQLAGSNQAIAQMQQTGRAEPLEKEYLCKDGSRVAVLLGGVMLEGQSDRGVSFAVDLSERKRAEAVLQQYSKQLEMALSLARLGSWEWNFETDRLLWTVQHEIIFGYEPGTPDRPYSDWANRLHPEDLTHTEALIQAALDSQEDFECEYRILWADQSVRWVSASARLQRHAAGKPVGMVGLVADITDRKRIEAERLAILERERNAREAAEAANRIKDEFLAVLSHELRSPLNPILGWTKLLRTRKFDATATDRALETIERNAKLQTQLIEDLLDVSRILRGKMTLKVSPVNLIPTIESAMETVRLSAEARSIRLRFEVESGRSTPILVWGDGNRLQQVVWNLLANAVKFTPDGGEVTARLQAPAKDDPVQDESAAIPHPPIAQITVTDTGKGINPEFLPYVFEYFRQADGGTTRQFGGLGLGLAIVQHLVELHGGTVHAFSLGENQGATFTVQIPLLKAATELGEPEPPLTLSPQSPPLIDRKILVVDDEADMRDYVAFVLEQAGATVTIATSAAEAMAALSQQIPDLLITDIGMPNQDGYSLMQQVRDLDQSQGGEVPAIALTAYAGELDQKQALKAGFQVHLPKPVEPDHLISVVCKLVQQE